MVLLKKIELFTMCAFLPNQERKYHFLIFWIEKNKFLDREVKFQKRPKNWIFQRVHVKKLSFLPCVLFGQTKEESSLFNIVSRKEFFLDQKSEVLKTSGKSNFSKGLVHGFCEKIELCTMRSFFQANQGRKDRFFSWFIPWVSSKTWAFYHVGFLGL